METLGVLLIVIGGFLIAYGIWNLIRGKLAIGKVYDQSRKDLEKIRKDLQSLKNPDPEDLAPTIEKFNKLAKELGIPKYGED